MIEIKDDNINNIYVSLNNNENIPEKYKPYIITLYKKLKENNYPTENLIENIKTLIIKEVDNETLIEHGHHKNTNATYNVYNNVIYFPKERKVLNSTIYHELLHCASSKRSRLLDERYSEYDGIEFIPISGIGAVLPGIIPFGEALNEGLTEFLVTSLFPEEVVEMHISYLEMTAVSGLLNILTGNKLYKYYFKNDVKGFYQLMHETFGKNWVKIINDCENSYTLQLAYGHKYEKIYDLIRLKYNLMIVNSFFKNNTDKEYEREVLKGYFNCHYPEDSNSKKIIDHKIKVLDKRYPIKK